MKAARPFLYYSMGAAGFKVTSMGEGKVDLEVTIPGHVHTKMFNERQVRQFIANLESMLEDSKKHGDK